MKTDNNYSELSKTYNPENLEKEWYQKWDNGGYFKPRKNDENKTYSLVMPPPNVTGRLHMGHALDITTQDALIRFKRMKGYETLWIPGADHAGIATQSVVEKLVYDKEKKTKHDFTREEFLKKIWKWKEEYGDIINEQQKSLGASPDWDSFMFTMDPEANEAVRTFFVQLYNEGLIYQSDYIVNWDPVLQSAISDAEVEHKEVKGAFYNILYKVKNSDIILEIATTRPETLLGDTAVAVNPHDKRFNHLIGKTAIVPICNREVPIVGDEHVDIEKGTGCLKVTPGHDFNDFEIGKRHNLEIINILNNDGSMNKNGLEFEGMACKQARKEIVKKLKELEILVDIKDHIHPVGHGERSKAIIEPIVSKQWFVNTTKMSNEAVKAVEGDKTKFYPKGWENTYFSWLRNPRDWCISRQLWWGHQIPVFYCQDCNHTWADVNLDPKCIKCNSSNIAQDKDVLDTWFSSGLWPMTLLGWPDKKRMELKGFDKFFPTDTLITGYDIIFFWVARMMMMSLKAVDNIPFEKIYIHALVRDKFGVKMSKSLGNGIDPLDMIDTYGADALRFTLAAGSGYNRNLNLDPERIAGYRNFINKIWNAFRFISPFLNEAPEGLPEIKNLDHHERWILSELNTVTKSMNESMEDFRFDDSCSTIYSFVYDKFCSWFIELSKTVLYSDDEMNRVRRSRVLKYAFKKILALLHPFIPFITEELWSQLKDSNDELLIVTKYPEFNGELEFTSDQSNMNKFIEVVTCMRNLRASVNIKPKDEVNAELFSDSTDLLNYFNNNSKYFYELAKVKTIKSFSKDSDRPSKSIMAATTHSEIFIPLEGVINLDDQIKRLEKDLLKANKEYSKLEGKLNNKKFISNAPEEVVIEVKSKANEFKDKIDSLTDNIIKFKN